jgi:hypothetical protein
VYGLAVSRSGYGYECMGWLYLNQYMGLSVRVYWLAESRSRQRCEGNGWLYLGQDMGVSVWPGCI